jgi:hypothetical protein
MECEVDVKARGGVGDERMTRQYIPSCQNLGMLLRFCICERDGQPCWVLLYVVTGEL